MIRLVKESKRHYVFTADETLIDKDLKDVGVKIAGGFLWFNKDGENGEGFSSIDECIAFFTNYKDADGSLIKSQDFEKKAISETKIISTKISDGDWALIKRFLPGNSTKTIDDFMSYDDYLTGNYKDRDGERFVRRVIERFDKTIVGRQKMLSHSWYSMGVGKYYKSMIKQMKPEEILEFLFYTHPNKKILEELNLIEKRDGGLFILVPSFYIPKTQEDIIDAIESGIPSNSIGFRGLKRYPYKDDDGNLLWTELDWDEETEAIAEALEGSLVGVESQYGMRPKDFNGALGITKKDLKDAVTVLSSKKNLDDSGNEDDTKDIDTKPYPNEHACRLNDPKKYDKLRRKNCDWKSDGKCIDVIYGIKNNKSEVQALRFDKDTWTASSAREYCKKKKGKFEPASEKTDDEDIIKNSPDPKIDGGKMIREIILNDKVKAEVDSDNLEASIAIAQKTFTEYLATLEKTNEESLKTLKAQVEQLDSIKKALGDDISAEAIEKIEKASKDVKEVRDILVTNLIKLKCLVGLLDAKDEEKVKEYTESLKNKSSTEMRTLINEFLTLYEKQSPNKGILPEVDPGLNIEGQKNKPEEQQVISAHIVPEYRV